METISVKGFMEMLEILDNNDVSRDPVYTGWGIEIYENQDQETQIVYNATTNIVELRKGF